MSRIATSAGEFAIAKTPAYRWIRPSDKIPELGATAEVEDPVAVVKLFNPTGSWTWYLIEADTVTGEAFALVEGHETELGAVDLNELAEYTGQFGLKVERDIHWTPRKVSEIRAKGGR